VCCVACVLVHQGAVASFLSGRDLLPHDTRDEGGACSKVLLAFRAAMWAANRAVSALSSDTCFGTTKSSSSTNP